MIRGVVLLPIVLHVCLGAVYQPQRTAIRDKLFFGIEDQVPPGGKPAAATAPVALPPASSMSGVNHKAASDSVLNNFGSLGAPEGVTLKKKGEASFMFYQSEHPHHAASFTVTVKEILNILSVIWLVLIVAGCYMFMSTALERGSQKLKFGGAQVDPVTERYIESKRVENMKIDRESYVYVEGG